MVTIETIFEANKMRIVVQVSVFNVIFVASICQKNVSPIFDDWSS